MRFLWLSVLTSSAVGGIVYTLAYLLIGWGHQPSTAIGFVAGMAVVAFHQREWLFGPIPDRAAPRLHDVERPHTSR